MKFSYNWIQSYFDKPLPKPEKLAELLTMRSFETESNGEILDIDVLPNRVADCASHLGIAREIFAVLKNKNFAISNFQFLISKQIQNSKFKTEDYIELEIKEKDLCPRYVALLIKNVKVKPSPKWLQERLALIGQKSINNIVDAANYAMLETGQPIHAFDLEKIENKKIVVRKAENKEKIETLDNKIYELDENTLVIADAKNALAIAGIKGGKKAEITNNTKDIIIEAAVFNPQNIRRTSRCIGLKTDASLRFEHGLSLFLPENAIERTAQLTQEIAGGEVSEKSIDICEIKPELPRIIFNEKDVEKLIGVRISADKIKKTLKDLGFQLSRSNLDSSTIEVRPPIERLDIEIKEDIIEEIARIHGYENIKPEMPGNAPILPKRNEEYFFINLIRGILAGIGFSEVYNYSFSLEGSEKNKIENPISSDKAYLRRNFTAGLKENIKNNLKNFNEVKLFEIGKVFNAGNEKIKVALAIGYKDTKKQKEAVYELKGAVDILLEKLGITDSMRVEAKENVCELDLEKIIERAGENIDLPIIETGEDIQYKPFSKYPAIIRDISLFVLPDTKVAEVMDVIENTAGMLLADTDLFDEYLPLNGEKKSLAFRLIFQSYEKTLTDKEVNELMDKIINALDENIKWEVRKK